MTLTTSLNENLAINACDYRPSLSHSVGLNSRSSTIICNLDFLLPALPDCDYRLCQKDDLYLFQ